MIRIEVKLAASMLVSFSANRQSKEFPAKAVMASSVMTNSRVRDNQATPKELSLPGDGFLIRSSLPYARKFMLSTPNVLLSGAPRSRLTTR